MALANSYTLKGTSDFVLRVKYKCYKQKMVKQVKQNIKWRGLDQMDCLTT